MKLLNLREFELATRPIHPETRIALDRRWAELPEHAKTDNQLLGRCAVGCEGTHEIGRASCRDRV